MAAWVTVLNFMSLKRCFKISYLLLSGFPGEGMQQQVYAQLPNIDQYQQRVLGMQQEPMLHQVLETFPLCTVLNN